MFEIVGLSFLAMMLLGLAWFMSARASKKIDSEVAVFWLQFIGIPLFVFLIPFNTVPVSQVSFEKIFLVGFGFTFFYRQVIAALKLGKTSVVTPVIQCYALITALLGIVFLNESVSALKIAGMILVVVGAVLLATKISPELFTQFSKRLEPGMKQAVFGAIGMGMFFFIMTLMARESGWFYSALIVRVALTLTIGFLIWRKKKAFSVPRSVWKWLVGFAIFDVAGFSLFNYTVTLGETSLVSIIVSAQSLIVIPLSIIFLREKMHWRQVAGFIGVFIGLILLQL